MAKYHAGFHQANIAVDMIGADTNLEHYKILVAPVMYLLKPGVADKVTAWVEAGGTLVTSFMSGVADSSDLKSSLAECQDRLKGFWACG